jgi:F0F1-type ATP synthase assembly protein I
MSSHDDIHDEAKAEDKEDKSEKRNAWVQLAKYSQLAFVFPAATVAGWLIGAAMDRWLHTTWLYLAGLILGIVAGFVELIRAALSSDSK